MKILIIASALLGALSISLGAFAAHALKNKLDDYAKGIWETAVQYQSIHTVCILIVGFALFHFQNSLWLSIAGYSWIIGVVIFSGSLYALALSDIKWLGAITPIGGVALIVGWLALLIFAVKELQ